MFEAVAIKLAPFLLGFAFGLALLVAIRIVFGRMLPPDTIWRIDRGMAEFAVVLLQLYAAGVAVVIIVFIWRVYTDG